MDAYGNFPPDGNGSIPSSSVPGKLFVGNIGFGTTEDAVRAYFAAYGEVVDCNLVYERFSAQHRGYGFVTFATPAMTSAVLQQTHMLDGRVIDVQAATGGAGRSGGGGGGGGAGGRRGGGAHMMMMSYPGPPPGAGMYGGRFNARQQVGPPAGVMPPQLAPQPQQQQLPRPPFHPGKVFVGGLAPTVLEADFRAYFERYGRISDAVVMMDRATRRSRGFGFVTFEAPQAAAAVLSAQHALHGKPVEVKAAEPRDMAIGGGGGPGDYDDLSGMMGGLQLSGGGSMGGGMMGGGYGPMGPGGGLYGSPGGPGMGLMGPMGGMGGPAAAAPGGPYGMGPAGAPGAMGGGPGPMGPAMGPFNGSITPQFYPDMHQHGYSSRGGGSRGGVYGRGGSGGGQAAYGGYPAYGPGGYTGPLPSAGWGPGAGGAPTWQGGNAPYGGAPQAPPRAGGYGGGPGGAGSTPQPPFDVAGGSQGGWQQSHQAQQASGHGSSGSDQQGPLSVASGAGSAQPPLSGQGGSSSATGPQDSHQHQQSQQQQQQHGLPPTTSSSTLSTQGHVSGAGSSVGGASNGGPTGPYGPASVYSGASTPQLYAPGPPGPPGPHNPYGPPPPAPGQPQQGEGGSSGYGSGGSGAGGLQPPFGALYRGDGSGGMAPPERPPSASHMLLSESAHPSRRASNCTAYSRGRGSFSSSLHTPARTPSPAASSSRSSITGRRSSTGDSACASIGTEETPLPAADGAAAAAPEAAPPCNSSANPSPTPSHVQDLVPTPSSSGAGVMCSGKGDSACVPAAEDASARTASPCPSDDAREPSGSCASAPGASTGVAAA